MVTSLEFIKFLKTVPFEKRSVCDIFNKLVKN